MSDNTRPDDLSEQDVTPHGELTDYQRGYIEGMTLYAWMKDGVLYVGTTGRTLRQAKRDFLVKSGQL